MNDKTFLKNWVSVRLSDLFIVETGSTPKTNIKDFWNGSIKWITPKDLGRIKSNYIYDTERKITKLALQKNNLKVIPADSIILSTRAPIGYIAILKDNMTFNQGCKGLVKKSNEINIKFFYYLLLTKVTEMNRLGSGSTFKEISKSKIENLKIPLPPLAEQHRMVAKIEELFSKLDAGVEALKKAKEQIKRYRQAVLKYAFEGKLTEEWRKNNFSQESASELLEKIKEERKKKLGKKYKELPQVDTSELPELPEGWAWVRVKDIGEVVTGTTPSKAKQEYYGKIYPFFKPTDLNAGYYVNKSEDALSEKGVSKARLLPSKSILVTCIGATIGKTGFIRIPGASNQQINAIIPHHHILPEYIFFICISPQFQKRIIENASATTLPILNKSSFEVLPLPLPPLIEQHKIVEEIERRFSIADEIEKVIDNSLKQAERLRQSILKKAFEGKLVPQDPNDEPAEKLLKRILNVE